MRVTANMAAAPFSSAKFQTRSVLTPTPSTAQTEMSAVSATGMASFASVRKLLYPGVSSRLTLTPSQSKWVGAALRLMPRSISSSSKSVVVFPSSTRARRVTAPAA